MSKRDEDPLVGGAHSGDGRIVVGHDELVHPNPNRGSYFVPAFRIQTRIHHIELLNTSRDIIIIIIIMEQFTL